VRGQGGVRRNELCVRAGGPGPEGDGSAKEEIVAMREAAGVKREGGNLFVPLQYVRMYWGGGDGQLGCVARGGGGWRGGKSGGKRRKKRSGIEAGTCEQRESKKKQRVPYEKEDLGTVQSLEKKENVTIFSKRGLGRTER